MQFCSCVSREAGEPLNGTATPVKGYLLIGCSKGEWGEAPEESSYFPSNMAGLLDELYDRHGILVRFFDHPAETVRLIAFPMEKEITCGMEDLPAILQSFIQGSGYLAWPSTDGKKFFLVCTHGQRDQCCAKFGYPLFEQVRDWGQIHSAHGMEVLQSSHLGGDRFAPASLALPQGHMYGRVDASEVDDLLNAVIGGKVYAGRYRGSSFLSQDQQLIDCYVHSFFSPRAVRGWYPVHENRYEAVLEDGSRHRFTVEIDKTAYRVYSDCCDLKIGHIQSFPRKSSRLILVD